MKRAYKIEINPSNEQMAKIRRTIGVCRFIYNFYINHNQEEYSKGRRFVSGMDFSKWLNNEYLPNHIEQSWIKEISSKAVKQSIMNGEKAFKRFFQGLGKFPRFKKKKDQDIKVYFPKNNKTDWTIERHRVKIPTLGWVRLKEFGYIPENSKVKSGTVSQRADRYYVSILVEVEEDSRQTAEPKTEGLGIDLGLKEFAVLSDGTVKRNINKSSTVKKLEKRLKREQRKLSRKYESLKLRNKNMKGGNATRQNIQKQILVVQKIHRKLANIRTNYINNIVNDIIKRNPSFITIEDLAVSNMMKNRHLSKAVAGQKFHEFKVKLIGKASLNGIEIRIADRFYPSSKLCSNCGSIKKDLKLKDRVYNCSCGLRMDRDLNAAINLANISEYKTA